jgi:hypothetical protein
MAWYISTSEEGHYYGDCPDREDAIATGILEGYDSFWLGESRPPKPLSEGIYADSIVENAMENLEEDWCLGLDFANFEPTEEQLEALQSELRNTVDRWIEQHRLQPQWSIIDSPERIDVSGEEAA